MPIPSARRFRAKQRFHNWYTQVRNCQVAFSPRKSHPAGRSKGHANCGSALVFPEMLSRPVRHNPANNTCALDQRTGSSPGTRGDYRCSQFGASNRLRTATVGQKMLLSRPQRCSGAGCRNGGSNQTTQVSACTSVCPVPATSQAMHSPGYRIHPDLSSSVLHREVCCEAQTGGIS